jgi:hypothetical protein
MEHKTKIMDGWIGALLRNLANSTPTPVSSVGKKVKEEDLLAAGHHITPHTQTHTHAYPSEDARSSSAKMIV